LRSLFTALLIILFAVLAAGPSTAAGTVRAEPPGTPPHAGIGIRLLDMPANLLDDPRARTYIVDRTAPGTELTRRVRVENNTGTRQTVRVYPGAAHIDHGAFVGDDASVTNELTAWAHVAQPEVELAAGSFADVLTTIKVPADAPEAEQYGAIWAEIRSSADDGGVVQANRVGIRIYLSVGPGNGKPADFTITSVPAGRGPEGGQELRALVTNTGGRALDITGELTLATGPGGLSAGPFGLPGSTTIATGDARVVVFGPLGELPDRSWTARLKLRSGLLERRAEATVTLSGASPEDAAAPASKGVRWLPLAAVASAVPVGIAAAWLMRRRRVSSPGVEASPPQVP
jgi:hypothetical protein